LNKYDDNDNNNDNNNNCIVEKYYLKLSVQDSGPGISEVCMV
jgi:hypothetical protein